MDKRPVLYLWRSIRRHIVNRKYKDHLFRIIFHEKTDLLELYNAVNNSSYTDPEALTITTLRDVIFLGMKNDLSFLIGSQLNLYEHQSTWNENMPLRGLFYFSDMLRAFVEDNNLNIYKETKIELPTPRYIVFYNGSDKHPDQVELKLSDAFPEIEGKVPCLECTATMLNINYGRNRELMKKCRVLSEYAQCVSIVREHTKGASDLRSAIRDGVDDCISRGILREYLLANKAEVVEMLLTEYNEQKTLEQIRRESEKRGKEEGLKLGREEGLKLGKEEGLRLGKEEGLKLGETRALFVISKLLQANRQDEVNRIYNEPVLLDKLAEEFGFEQ